MFHLLMKHLRNRAVFTRLSNLGYLIYLLQAALPGCTARINVQRSQNVAALPNYLLSRRTGPPVLLTRVVGLARSNPSNRTACAAGATTHQRRYLSSLITI
jgi:hypothetical protein